MIDEKTTHHEYSLPHEDNLLEDDVNRIRDSFNKIDLDVNNLTTSISDSIRETQAGTYLHTTSTGSGAAYLAALTPPLLSLAVGQVIHMTAHVDNIGTATLDVDGIGPQAIKKIDGSDLEDGDILTGAVCILFYDGTNFQLINPSKAKIDLSGVSANAQRIAELESAYGINDAPLDLFNHDLFTDTTSAKTTSDSNSGQTDVIVDSVTGLSVGMSVDLLHATDKAKSEISKIVSINSLTLTMENPLNHTYPTGSDVKRDGLLRQVGKKKLPFSSLTGAGDGRDGSVNLVTPHVTTYLSNSIVGSLRSDYPDAIERVVTQNPTGTTINVLPPEEEGFAVGDLVLLMNKQGSPGDAADVGNHEILTVVSTSTGAIHVEETISKSYGGTTFSNQKITVQRIPQYTTVTLNDPNTTLRAPTWSSYNGIGGVLIFACSESLNLTSGIISAEGSGYNGSHQSGHHYSGHGEGTEGPAGPPDNSSPSTNANGNGGGGGNNYQGGAGGGHATAGTDSPSSIGGFPVGDINLLKMIFGGGGGGNGRGPGGTAYNSSGGYGGGIIYIFAETANITGTINVNGKNGNADSSGSGGGGGGGAGGTILIKSKNLNFSSSDLLTANGGTGGGNGKAGGQGRVRLEYSTINGQAHPNATEENDATNPDPGSTALATLNTGSLAARHRSLVTNKPQRDIESMDLWTKCPVTTSNASTSGTATDFIINGISAGEEVNYGIGDTILLKLSTGKYLENTNGTPYNPKVTSNATSGEITVDTAIPSTFSGATLQRLDLIPRASVVTTGANENMESMVLQFIEETGNPNEIETEWFLDKSGSEGQNVTIEIGLSVEDANSQENTYCEQYTTNLNYA